MYFLLVFINRVSSVAKIICFDWQVNVEIVEKVHGFTFFFINFPFYSFRIKKVVQRISCCPVWLKYQHNAERRYRPVTMVPWLFLDASHRGSSLINVSLVAGVCCILERPNCDCTCVKEKRLDIRLYIIQKKVDSSYSRKRGKKVVVKFEFVIQFLFDYLIVYYFWAIYTVFFFCGHHLF